MITAEEGASFKFFLFVLFSFRFGGEKRWTKSAAVYPMTERSQGKGGVAMFKRVCPRCGTRWRVPLGVLRPFLCPGCRKERAHASHPAGAAHKAEPRPEDAPPPAEFRLPREGGLAARITFVVVIILIFVLILGLVMGWLLPFWRMVLGIIVGTE